MIHLLRVLFLCLPEICFNFLKKADQEKYLAKKVFQERQIVRKTSDRKLIDIAYELKG